MTAQANEVDDIFSKRSNDIQASFKYLYCNTCCFLSTFLWRTSRTHETMAFASILPTHHSLQANSALCISGARFANIQPVTVDFEINENTEQFQTETDRPKHPDYASSSARADSFYGWNSQNVSANDLAAAGFYYTGIKDYVRCFSCGGGIKDWDIGDDPWSEHNKWYPNCAYIKRNPRRCNRSGSSQASLSSSNQASAGSQPTIMSSPVRTKHTTENLVPSLPGSPLGISNIEPEVVNLMAENRQLKEQRICKICLDQEACIVFLPCGHLVACVQCSHAIRKCAVCRAIIQDKVRVYQA